MISEPAASLTSVSGGISNAEAEAASVVIGATIAVLPLYLLVYLRRRILVVFRAVLLYG